MTTITLTCTGCGRVLIATPDDEALIAMESWWEDEQDRTWCAGCDPDDEPVRNPNQFTPVAIFADGSTWGYPTPAGADPWSLLNRARYGCQVCDQLIEHDDITGDHRHDEHIAATVVGACPGRRFAA